jgi:hypothetical protein
MCFAQAKANDLRDILALVILLKKKAFRKQKFNVVFGEDVSQVLSFYKKMLCFQGIFIFLILAFIFVILFFTKIIIHNLIFDHLYFHLSSVKI